LAIVHEGALGIDVDVAARAVASASAHAELTLDSSLVPPFDDRTVELAHSSAPSRGTARIGPIETPLDFSPTRCARRAPEDFAARSQSPRSFFSAP